ncbi:MAG: NYN domain-containing protein [Chloroflexota bacterium]
MLLIDGHNLIGKLPNISLSDPDDEAKLLRVLENYHALHPHEPITVVFDAGRDGGWSPVERGASVTVRFASRGTTADAVIVKMIRQQPNARHITVVTSDNAIRKIVRQHGAKLLTSEEFVAKLREDTRPRRLKPVEVVSDDEREKPTDTEVEYWSTIFKEPKRKPKPKPTPLAPSASPSASSSAASRETDNDVAYWLKVFGEPAETPAETKPKRKPRAPSAESGVEYWLNEFSKKR